MIQPDLESRILELALLQGALSTGDLEIPVGEPSGEDNLAWGPRISALIRSGRLSPERVESLARQLMEMPMFTLPTLAPEPGPSVSEFPSLSTWKGYSELKPLGMGGGGLVYQAWDSRLDREVALKFPRPGQASAFAQTLKEARAQARIDHPNVVKVYEVGEHQGQPFIAMQRIRGESLMEIRDRLTLEQKVKLVIQVAEALQAAHELGLIHLDIKPSNILVECGVQNEPHAYITDFGLVREEAAEARIQRQGTPGFASPEQMSGDFLRLDRRSDVFSLGATCYALLTGCPPESGKQQNPIPSRQRDPRLPLDLEAIAWKCLHWDPDERYVSARALAEDLRRFLRHLPVEARPSTFGYLLQSWLRRNTRVAILGSVAVLLVSGLAFWNLHSARRASFRMRLAEQYGREVQSMEQALRLAHLSRLHDRRPTVAMIRGSMERIRNDMAQMGPDALGPGSYALGEGHRALHEFPEARRFLDQAWAAGFRTPACARTRGEILSRLYQEEKAKIVFVAPAEREQRLQTLTREYRNPALESFQTISDLNASYALAMQAYLNGDLPKTLILAAQATKSTPWLYEALVLQHQIHMELGMELIVRGDRNSAKQHFLEAGGIIDQVLEVAPSDPVNWTEKGSWAVHMAKERGLPPEEVKARLMAAQAAFESSLRVDADQPDAYQGLEQAFRRLAEEARLQGQDAMPYLDQAVNIGNQARASYGAYPRAAWAFFLRSQEKLIRGQDPRGDLDQAILQFRQAEQQGGVWENIQGLQHALHLRGIAAYAEGEDPLPYFRESLPWCLKASETVLPESGQRKRAALNLPHAALSVTPLDRRIAILEMEDRLGRSPSESLEAIRGECEKQGQMAPDNYYLKMELGRIQLLEATRRIAQKQDPRPFFAASLEFLESALPRYAYQSDLHQLIAEWALIHGAWCLRSGHPAASVLQRGLIAALEYQKIEPWDFYDGDLKRALEYLRARSEGRDGDHQRLRAALQKRFAGHPYSARFLGVHLKGL